VASLFGDVGLLALSSGLVRRRSRRFCARGFLPACSPDLNPIEKMWSKIKACLRAAEARTQEQLDAAIGDALEKITANDARRWFASCGYSFM